MYKVPFPVSVENNTPKWVEFKRYDTSSNEQGTDFSRTRKLLVGKTTAIAAEFVLQNKSLY